MPSSDPLAAAASSAASALVLSCRQAVKVVRQGLVIHRPASLSVERPDCAGMERKSGLGFGFFNKARNKKKGQRSERQMADMYDKVAIRGSIQHVWGETARPTAPARAQTMPVVVSDQETSPALLQRPETLKEMHAQSMQDYSLVNVVGDAQGALTEGQASPASSPRMGSAIPHGAYEVPHISPTATIHKKFSFCPSTISVVSQNSPASATQAKTLRRSSLNSAHYPYRQSQRSSLAFSSSTPSVHHQDANVRERMNSQHSDHVSIVDDEEERDYGTQISPSNSLCYSNSIISRISSTMESPHMASKDDRFLPGTIYAGMLPDALRGLGSVNALPLHYDEDDDDDEDDAESSSISGLSEVNADNSDSDFDMSDDEADEQKTGSMITTDINDKLRRDSVKRVSYTQLENGEYLVSQAHRSRNWASLDAGAGIVRSTSDASQWSIEKTYISGII